MSHLSDEIKKEYSRAAEYKKVSRLREVSLKSLIFCFYVQIPLLAIFITGIVHSVVFSTATGFAVQTLVFSVLTYISLRIFAIGCVYAYKAYAPMRIRGSCRHIPSCSSYAVISLKRYGIIIGVVISLIRIQRCRPPYGGEDYPQLKHVLRLFKK